MNLIIEKVLSEIENENFTVTYENGTDLLVYVDLNRSTLSYSDIYTNIKTRAAIDVETMKFSPFKNKYILSFQEYEKLLDLNGEFLYIYKYFSKRYNELKQIIENS